MGDTYNGRLVSCDTFMNMNLVDVICTSSDGNTFVKMPSCYIRGSSIKYLRLPPDLLDKAAEEAEREAAQYQGRGRGEGRGGRGRGEGRGRSGRGDGRGRGRGGGRGRGEGRGARGGRQD